MEREQTSTYPRADNYHQQKLVSVIVPTKNSGATLEAALSSVVSQSYKDIEIIIVDNHSTDNTLDIAYKYTDKVFIHGPERTAQVNFGIRQAVGEYIYRVDSDFVLDSSVLAQAVDQCESKKCAAVIIHNTSDDTVSFWSRVRKFERDMYREDSLNVAARFFRKDILEGIGMFDESMVAAEDYDLHNRIAAAKLKIGRISAQEIHLGEPKTLVEILKKHYYYGKTLKMFLQKNKRRGVKQLMPVRPAYIKHWRLFVRHPLLTGGFVAYQVARYIAAILGYAIGSKEKPRTSAMEAEIEPCNHRT